MPSPKTSGTAHELAFAAACAARGGIISFTFGDNAPYDLIVDNGVRLIKVQLKKAHYRPKQRRWVANAWRRSRLSNPTTSVAVPYKDGEVDCVVTLAGSNWYFLFNVHALPSCVGIYPDRDTCPYGQVKDDWQLIGLPNIAYT